jgi:hypothetical protein
MTLLPAVSWSVQALKAEIRHRGLIMLLCDLCVTRLGGVSTDLSCLSIHFSDGISRREVDEEVIGLEAAAVMMCVPEVCEAEALRYVTSRKVYKPTVPNVATGVVTKPKWSR